MSLSTVSSSPALNPLLSLNPQERAREHAFKEDLWNFAKSVDVLGYMGVSAGAFVATSVFAPHLIIPVTLGVFLAMPSALHGFNYADKAANDHANQKMRFARISEIQSQLAALPAWKLREKFEDAGIPRNRIRDFEKVEGGLARLTTGFATLIYLCECTNELFKKYKGALAELPQISQPNYRILHMREIYAWGRAAMAARVHAAFMHAILRRPFSQQSLDDIGSLANPSPEAYALENFFAQNRSPVFVFHDEAKRPLQEDDLEVLDASPYTDFRKDISELNSLASRIIS